MQRLNSFPGTSALHHACVKPRFVARELLIGGRPRVLIVVAGALLMLALFEAPSPAEGAASFQGLGLLPGWEADTLPRGVSDDGSVVVGDVRRASNFGGESQAFRWDASGIIGLGYLPGVDINPADRTGPLISRAYDVSADGSVIVGESLSADSTSGGFQLRKAFRWENGNMVALNDPDIVGQSQARAVSADGSVVAGGAGFSGRFGPVDEAFRWESNDVDRLGLLGRNQSLGLDISADGSVVVGVASSGVGGQAFRWENGNMVSLGDLPGGLSFPASVAFGVSNDGAVVVGNSSGHNGFEAYRWENGNMVGLGDLPGGNFSSDARAVSGDGSIVVGRGESDSGSEAFIWNATSGMRRLHDALADDFDLDLAGWTLFDATAISRDGTAIVGTGRNPTGNFEAWLARLPPAFRWANAVDGDWSDGTKWEGGTPPGPGDTAVFDLTGTYNVVLTDNTTVGEIQVLSGNVNLEFNDFWLQSDGVTLGTPDGAAVKLAMTGGDGVAAVSAASFDQVGISSADAEPVPAPQPNEFRALNRPLRIRGGLDSEFHTSDLSSVKATAGAVIDGTAVVGENGLFLTTGLVIGDSDEGLLTLQRGSSTLVDRADGDESDDPVLVIGDDQPLLGLLGGNGWLEMDGGTMLVEGPVLIADAGDALVTVHNGSTFNAIHGVTLADNLGSEASISVHGAAGNEPSTLLVASMTIGGDGDAGVSIFDGGRALIAENDAGLWQIGGDSSLVIGSSIPGRESRVELPHNSVLVIEIAGPLFGDATMTVGVEAVVEATAVTVGEHNIPQAPRPSEGDGKLTVRGQPLISSKGGLLKIYDELIVGRQGEVEIVDGGGVMVGSRSVLDLTLRSDFNPADKLVIFEGGSFRNAGTVTVGSFENRGATLVASGAIYETGTSPGRAIFNSDFIAEVGSRLIFEIGGLTPAEEYDQLVVNGDVMIDGTILLKFLDGFTPQQGQQFEFLTVGGTADLSGATFEIQNLAPGFLFDITPSASGFTMTALNDGRFVPEPATIVLLLMAVAAGSGRRLKRYRQTEDAR